MPTAGSSQFEPLRCTLHPMLGLIALAAKALGASPFLDRLIVVIHASPIKNKGRLQHWIEKCPPHFPHTLTARPTRTRRASLPV